MRVSVIHPQAEIRLLVVGQPPTVAEDATVRESAQAIRNLGSSAALVAGTTSIVTERDLTAAWARGMTGDEPVTLIASAQPIAVPGDTPVVDAAAAMLNCGVRHLIVVDGPRVGVVSLRTVMAVLLQAAQPELWMSSLRLSISEASEAWLG